MKIIFPILSAALALVLSGCVTASPAEQAARQKMQAAASELTPDGDNPALPALHADSPPGDFIRYAVLNHPTVRAAWHDWHAAVESIAPARALPDPRFTFQADITEALMSFMPGLMFDFMSAGKRTAMAREATAASEVAYRSFVAAVLGTAAQARRAWIELAYATEAVQLQEAAVASLGQTMAVAGADYTTGRMMTSLEAQVQLENKIAEQRARQLALTDRLASARARFKSALGLAPTDTDPPWPAAVLVSTTLPPEDELWRHALAANPDLARMRAMIDMAIAGVEVAGKTRTPDFALGLMADLKASPLMLRPTASVSLPVWREKIAATIAAAEARRDAASARVTAEQLNLAAELAQMLYMVREADRMIAYIDDSALPNLERVAATAEAGYQSGAGGATMITDTRYMTTLMRLDRLNALRERENAVTDLLLVTADIVPAELKAGGLKN